MLLLLILSTFIYIYNYVIIKSIQKRCESDLEHFYDIYNIDPEHQDYKI